jgi:hypothetical protein
LGNPLRYSDKYGLDAFDWLRRKWDEFRGNQGRDLGKDIAADAIGRLQGAKCAKNCQQFKAPRDKQDIATEICLDLLPHVQADPIKGNDILQSCVKHCLRLLSENCDKPTCQ